MRNAFPLRSPQSGCSPAGSEGTPKRKKTYARAHTHTADLSSDFAACQNTILNFPFTFPSWAFPLHCFSAGSRPPLILQSPPPYAVSPREGGPDQKQQAQQRKKGPAVKEEKDMYDIVSSPNKDSTKLTLKLSRVKSNESDPPSK